MLNYKNNNTDMINPINKVVNKLGIDKVLHFLCGAVIAFVFNIIIIVQEAAMTTAKYFYYYYYWSYCRYCYWFS